MIPAEFSQLRQMMDTGDFRAVIDALDQESQSRPLCSDELVIKSRALQLIDTGGEDELRAAREALDAALRRNADHLPSRIERGWYLLNVEDDAGAAKKEFEHGLAMALEMWQDALTGLAKAMAELESSDKAIEITMAAASEVSERAKSVASELS